MVGKFNQDFNENLYEGIDLEKDTEKLRTYVGYFSEFRDVIKREQNTLEHEVVQMTEQREDYSSLLKMLDSLETQTGIIAKLQGKPDEVSKEMDVLHSEYKMFSLKRARVQAAAETQRAGALGSQALIGKETLSSGHSELQHYSRLADDYGHRRYIRKAQRAHRKRIW